MSKQNPSKKYWIPKPFPTAQEVLNVVELEERRQKRILDEYFGENAK